MQTLTIAAPDDWHVHLRDGDMLAAVVPHTAAHFRRAMVMPNLAPPVTTAAQALHYRAAILAALPAGVDFEPLMSLYLTDDTGPTEIAAAAREEAIVGGKWYPAGATTHAEFGVTSVEKIMPALEAMAECGLVLQVHGEVTDPAVDVYDREAVFIERVLAPLQRRLPELRIVLEHVTTEEGVQFVRAAGARVAATITPHHLLFNRNALFSGGLRPHAYCLPLPKRERHRRALVAAATGGETDFFLGTDSAPHARGAKESHCGCAGIYAAPTALATYTEVFEAAAALDKLEGFTSHHGADFYRVARNGGTITLEKTPYPVPAGDEIVPLRAGEVIPWSVCGRVD